MKIIANKNFLLTYIASFVSIFGSKLLMMSYVAFVYRESGSAALTSAVFVAEWTSSLVIGIGGARYVDGQNAKHLLIKLNLAAAVVTLSFAFVTAPQYYWYAIAIIAVRALLSHSVNAARVKALVQFFSKEETDAVSPIFNSSLFIAMALAGAVGVYIQSRLSFATIVVIDSVTFLVAAALLAFVKPNAERLAESIAGASTNRARGQRAYTREAFTLIAESTVLSSAVFYIILAVTVFQATYEIVMTVIPQLWFSLGSEGTVLFFTFESIFVTAGAFLYQFLSRRGVIRESNQRVLNLVAVGSAVTLYAALPLLRDHLYATLIVFNAMVVAIELIWTHQFKRIVSSSPTAKIAAITGLQTAIGYTLMGVVALLFSISVDRWGMSSALYGNALVICTLALAWELVRGGRETLAISGISDATK